MSESLHVIALAQAPEDGQDIPETPVLYTGSFEHSGRKIDVTEDDLDAAVANFNAQLAAGTEIPVDYEHGQAEGGIASGWYKSLRREGNRLLAKIAWTDKAREQIKQGARKYFSPEFTPAAKDETGKAVGFKLLAGALVVRPHLKGLGAVAMTDDAVRSLAQDVLTLAQVQYTAAPLNYSGLVPQNQTIHWTGTTLTPWVTGLPAPTPKDAPDMSDTVALKDFETVQTQLAEATEKITALSERVTAAEERAEQAESKHAETAKELFGERLTRTLDRAKREGRIDAKPETTEKWTERAERHGIEFVAELLNDIPAETIPVTERGHGSDRPITASEAPEGVDADSHAIHVRAEEIAKERDIDYAEAASIAYKEVHA